jgi:hypothetical protein
MENLIDFLIKLNLLIKGFRNDIYTPWDIMCAKAMTGMHYLTVIANMTEPGRNEFVVPDFRNELKG